MSKFKVGDVVTYLGPSYNTYLVPGAKGTICIIHSTVSGMLIYCKNWDQITVNAQGDTDWWVDINEVICIANNNENKLREKLGL